MTILFDLDGTLIDSTDAILEGFVASYENFGRTPPDEEDIKPLIGYPLDVMFQKLGITKDVWSYVEAYKKHYRIISRSHTTLLPLAKEAIKEARDLIKKSFGEPYLPKKAKTYTTKSKSAQEAHEAIRPTLLDFTPQIAKDYLKADELKLYTLIYNRFIASQMNDAQFESQSIIFESKSSKFKASGRRLVFDGFYKVLGSSDKDKLLPELKSNEPATLS